MKFKAILYKYALSKILSNDQQQSFVCETYIAVEESIVVLGKGVISTENGSFVFYECITTKKIRKRVLPTDRLNFFWNVTLKRGTCFGLMSKKSGVV